MVQTWNYKQQIEKVQLHLKRTWDWIQKEIEISQGTMASIWATAWIGGEDLTRSLRLLISSPDIVCLLIHYSTDILSLHSSPNFVNSKISCVGIFPNWYLNRQPLLMSLLSVSWTVAGFTPAPTSRLHALSKPHSTFILLTSSPREALSKCSGFLIGHILCTIFSILHAER